MATADTQWRFQAPTDDTDTTFREESATMLAGALHEDAHGPALRPRVLVVEDDPFIAIDLEDAFTTAGFEVVGPFAHPEPAIAATLANPPDVATLDYRLCGTTSRAVAKALDRADVPILMVTGSEAEMLAREGFAGREVFAKPCDIDRLIARSRELACT